LGLKGWFMDYLHTMIRVGNLDAALDFFCGGLGLIEVRRTQNEQGRFTLVFLATPGDAERFKVHAETSTPGLPAGFPMLELTHNWDEVAYEGGRNFGHLAYRVDDIYAICAHLAARGVVINRPPRDGHMAFVRSPDGISVELLQKGQPLVPKAPWADAPNQGVW
jgi:lactoylglutathione lyase